ncbi:MAG: DAK2 domain-containing protein [Chloroflexota bacterium]
MTDLAGPGAGLVELTLAVARSVAAQAGLLNTLDGIAGDGDLGITAGHAVVALEGVAAEAAALEPGPALRKLGRAIASGAPSSGGTLIAFALMAAAGGDDASGTPAARIIAGLRAAAASIAQRGDVTVGDRTMLDALSPAADAFAAASDAGASLAEAFARAATAADEGARATTGMEPKVGRAGWLKDRARGNEDPGARLVAIAFAALAAALAG